MTPQEENRIQLLEQRLREMEQKLRGVPSQLAEPDPGFWAKLTAYTLVDDNLWKYDWKEVKFTVDGDKLTNAFPATTPREGPFEGGALGDTTGWAWNSYELNNTDLLTGAGWTDQIVTMYDTFMTEIKFNVEGVNPVGKMQDPAVTDELFPVVWLRPVRLIGVLDLAYLFSYQNSPLIYAAVD